MIGLAGPADLQLPAGLALVAGVLAGLAWWVLGLRRLVGRRRLSRAAPSPARAEVTRRASREVDPAGPALPVTGAVLVLAAVASGHLVGPALLVGAAAMAGWLVLRGQAAGSDQAARAAARLVPAAADLLAACLSAGAAPADALNVVAETLGRTSGPGSASAALLAERLSAVAGSLRLGADVGPVWGPAPSNPVPTDPAPSNPDDSAGAASDPTGDDAVTRALAPLARAFHRASRTGAPLVATVESVADEQRRRSRWVAEAAAHRAGVAAVGPLAACFLPAFVLVGVVPVVLAMAADLAGAVT